MAGNVLSQALGLFLLPVFTAYLTPEDFGIFNYTNSIISFILIISTLSLNSFVLRHYFELDSEKDKKTLFGTTFLFILFFNIILLYLEFLLFPLLIRMFQIKIPFHPFFKIAFINNFIDAMAVIPLCYFRVTKKAWRYFWLTSSKTIITIVVGLILVVEFKMGILGRYYGILFPSLLFLILYFFVICKVSSLSINWSMIRKGLQFSLPILPAAFAAIAMISIDRIILERYVSVSQIGIYSVGATLGTVFSIVIRGFYMAVEPDIYRMFNQNGFKRKILNLKKNILYFVLIISCLFIVFSREIVIIMVSDQFYECYKIIPFFVVATIFRGTEILVGTTLYALNKTLYQPIIVGLALAANTVGNLILIPFLGILGAAISSAVSFWILYIVSVYITGKFSGINWKAWQNTIIVTLSVVFSYLILKFELNSIVVTFWIKLGIIALITAASLSYLLLIKSKREVPKRFV
jgi:O-antigen/teichoic acid export membrane protein